MTIYNHTVTFQDIERIEIENMVNSAINEFKLKHTDDGLTVPWVWESIIEKFRRAYINQLSGNNFAEISSQIADLS